MGWWNAVIRLMQITRLFTQGLTAKTLVNWEFATVSRER